VGENMGRGVSVNVEVKPSPLALLLLFMFSILIVGVLIRNYSPNVNLPENVFLVAAVVSAVILAIETHRSTNLGILPSLFLGFLLSFFLLALISEIGRLLLLTLVATVLLVLALALHYPQKY